MKRIIIIALLSLIEVTSSAQYQPGITRDSLIQLKKTKKPVRKYVNFDVFKFMLAHGRASDKEFNYGLGSSFRFQFLFPYSIFRESPLPIALGFTAGNNKIETRGVAFIFSGNQLQSITENNSIKYSWHRTRYWGPIAMAVLKRTKGLHFYERLSVLTGVSVEFNTSSLFKERHKNSQHDIIYMNTEAINKVSVPLHFQLSYPLNLGSFGLFYSHDTKPLFKGDKFRSLKQTLSGISWALVL